MQGPETLDANRPMQGRGNEKFNGANDVLHSVSDDESTLI